MDRSHVYHKKTGAWKSFQICIGVKKRIKYQMCSHGHSHDCEALHSGGEGSRYELFQQIDLDNVECLNEEVDESGRTVFKNWDERLDVTKFVESSADEELLINIPFVSNIKLLGITIIGDNMDRSRHPSEVLLFKTDGPLTFESAQALTPCQKIELHAGNTGEIDYATKPAKFTNVQHLVMYFPKNFGAETTMISYIGLRGEHSPRPPRHGVTITQYEARANPADHKTEGMDSMNFEIS